MTETNAAGAGPPHLYISPVRARIRKMKRNKEVTVRGSARIILAASVLFVGCLTAASNASAQTYNYYGWGYGSLYGYNNSVFPAQKRKTKNNPNVPLYAYGPGWGWAQYNSCKRDSFVRPERAYRC